MGRAWDRPRRRRRQRVEVPAASVEKEYGGRSDILGIAIARQQVRPPSLDCHGLGGRARRQPALLQTIHKRHSGQENRRVARAGLVNIG